MKFKNILSAGALCSSAFLFTQAHAITEDLSGSLSLDLNSHFISYGFNVWQGETEDIGDETLFNPSGGLEYSLSETSAVYVGFWADINSIGTGDIPEFGGLGGDFQELDLWVGYYFGVGKWTFDFTLQSWLYAGENEGIFDVTISYDTLFAPYLRAHNRFEANGGQEKGTIFELGGTIYSGEVAGISYSFPIGVAFNFDDYHQAGEDGYAYAFVGASASYVIYSSDTVEIDFHGGLTYFNTDDDNVGNIDDDILTANLGVGFSF